jgi:hypothetical protein
MATESELIHLLDAIGDRAPAADNTLNRLAAQAKPPAPSHRRWLPIAAVIATVAASVVISVAVRGDRPHHGAAGAGSAAPASTVDRATYPLPLDAYHASATQERTLERAVFVLAQRCARAHGVTVPAARIPAADPKPDFLALVANDVRPLTLQQARTIGYDLYPSGTPPVQAVQARLTPPQLEIYRGWSTDLKLTKPTDPFLLHGGCTTQAEQTLLKGAKPAAVAGLSTPTTPLGLFTDDATVNNVYLNAARSGETSAPVEQAQKRWSACMAVHGYPGLHTTEEAIGDTSNLQSASAKRRAVQDVQCKQSTGFMTVWIASMSKAQNAVITAHRSQLAGFKQRLATRMANAAKVLK